MPRLTEQEQQEIIRHLEADKPLPDKFRFLCARRLKNRCLNASSKPRPTKATLSLISFA